MFSKRNHLLYHFSITVQLQLASFYAQNTLKKYRGKMLIKQIIEFQLKKPGPPGRTCTHITGKLHDKNKNLGGKSTSGLLFTAKILQEAMCLAYPYKD